MTQDELKTTYHYDLETGIFTRLKDKKIAKQKNPYGYIVFNHKGKVYLTHRMAWLYIYGCMPTHQIDHINRVKDDNRILNLRDVTHKENQQNKSFKHIDEKIKNLPKTNVCWVLDTNNNFTKKVLAQANHLM